MRTIIKIAFIATLGMIVAACSEDAVEPETSRVETLADDYLAAVMERYPTRGTYYSIEGAEHDRLLVVVVSSDRPVSVIQDGLELNAQCRWAPVSGFMSASPEMREWIEEGGTDNF